MKSETSKYTRKNKLLLYKVHFNMAAMNIYQTAVAFLELF